MHQPTCMYEGLRTKVVSPKMKCGGKLSKNHIKNEVCPSEIKIPLVVTHKIRWFPSQWGGGGK